uniref:F-box protein n=1 Tax=Endozoicomonas sp. SESOKO4 TaxID=2828745 RepID=UPI0021482FF6
MDGLNNHPGIADPHPIPKIPAQSATLTGISAGRAIAVADNEKTSLLDLSPLPFSIIFRYLKLRDIHRLQQVCTHLHDAVKEDKALAKAWYRQFP